MIYAVVYFISGNSSRMPWLTNQSMVSKTLMATQNTATIATIATAVTKASTLTTTPTQTLTTATETAPTRATTATTAALFVVWFLNVFDSN